MKITRFRVMAEAGNEKTFYKSKMSIVFPIFENVEYISDIDFQLHEN